jgi:hypothetical protein
MRELIDCINERLKLNDESKIGSSDSKPTQVSKSSGEKWIAIEIETQDSFSHGKTHVNQRVVSEKTYNELYTTGHTKAHAVVVSLRKLGPYCSTSAAASDYLDKAPKKQRKTKIDKGDCDYIVYGISLGKLTPGGNTYFDWNIWEEVEKRKDPTCFYVIGHGRSGINFLMGADDGSLKVGDTVVAVDNDSLKKFPGFGWRSNKVDAIISVNSKDEFVKKFRKNFPNECSAPKRSFGRMLDGIPWKYFSMIYSIKGIST